MSHRARQLHFLYGFLVEVHLAVSQFGSIKNTVAMTLCAMTLSVCMDVCTVSFLLGKYLGVEWPDHAVDVCLTF